MDTEVDLEIECIKDFTFSSLQNSIGLIEYSYF